MTIEIAELTIATRNVDRMSQFLSALLGDTAQVEDHEYFFRHVGQADDVGVSVVPHNGDAKWDHPWITLGTDDLPGALKRLAELGVTDIQNSGPTDDEGNPIACVTFRDPDGRLMMLATSG